MLSVKWLAPVILQIILVLIKKPIDLAFSHWFIIRTISSLEDSICMILKYFGEEVEALDLQILK